MFGECGASCRRRVPMNGLGTGKPHLQEPTAKAARTIVKEATTTEATAITTAATTTIEHEYATASGPFWVKLGKCSWHFVKSCCSELVGLLDSFCCFGCKHVGLNKTEGSGGRKTVVKRFGKSRHHEHQRFSMSQTSTARPFEKICPGFLELLKPDKTLKMRAQAIFSRQRRNVCACASQVQKKRPD